MEKKVFDLFCEVHYAEDLYPHDEHYGTLFGTEEEVKAYVDAENEINSLYNGNSSYGLLSYRMASQALSVPAPRKKSDIVVRVCGSWRQKWRMGRDDDYGWYINIWTQVEKRVQDINEVKYGKFTEPEVDFYLRGIDGETKEEFIARAKARVEELLPAPEGKRLGEPEEEE